MYMIGRRKCKRVSVQDTEKNKDTYLGNKAKEKAKWFKAKEAGKVNKRRKNRRDSGRKSALEIQR